MNKRTKERLTIAAEIFGIIGGLISIIQFLFSGPANTLETHYHFHMCSEYQIIATKKKLEKTLGVNLMNLSRSSDGELRDEWDWHVKLTNKAPIIFLDSAGYKLDEYQFSIKPPGNARLSGLDVRTPDFPIRHVYDLPTWKKPFEHMPCLIPVSAFFEPCYVGGDAGKIMKFTTDESVMFVPGFRIKSTVPKTDHGFTMLTHIATKQMLKYHHRHICLLKPDDAVEYLEDMKGPDRHDFVLKKLWRPKLTVEDERQMAKGWHRRVEEHENDRAEEMEFVKMLEKA